MLRARADEDVVRLQVALHDVERRGAALLLVRELRQTRVVRGQMLEPEPGDGDEGLVAVLLEEHPAQHLGARPGVVGQERRAVGQVLEDRAGLRQEAAVLGLEHQDSAVRVLGQKRRRARFALHDVELDELEGLAQQVQQQPRLAAVARVEIVVQPEHSLFTLAPIIHGGHRI